MPAATEWQLWHQLRGAYAVDSFIFLPKVPEVSNLAYEHVDTIEEALALSIGQRVFLEVGGTKNVTDIPKTGDITIIVGNTSSNNAAHAQPDEMYAIDCPFPGELYGVNAAAIALALWHVG